MDLGSGMMAVDCFQCYNGLELDNEKGIMYNALQVDFALGNSGSLWNVYLIGHCWIILDNALNNG